MSKHPILNQLTAFPLTCSYILVDRSTDNALVQWSSGNSINQIAETVTELRRGIFHNQLIQNAFNRRSLKLKVLKSYKKPVDTLIMKAEAFLEFNKTAYTEVTGKYNKQAYKVYKHLMSDYRTSNQTHPLVYVTLKSRSVGAILIGLFDNMMEADEWLRINYPSGQINALIFCDNKLTKQYHKLKGYRCIRFREKT